MTGLEGAGPIDDGGEEGARVIAAGVFAFPAAFVVVADSGGEEISVGGFDFDGVTAIDLDVD